MAARTVFVVEQAGCESCAELVREVLEDVAPVAEIRVDEQEDRAFVELASASISEDDANRLLAEASGTGHAYHIASGSWAADPADP